jgi:hypothetical protein
MVWSDDDDNQGPLSLEILNTPLPKGLEKPPSLGQYDGQGDPDDHIAHINVNLQYQRVKGPIRCRLFPTTLKKGALDWYKSLPPGSITSWGQLCTLFSRHFTASRRHPKTVASLEAIVQKENEPLRSYLERFNKEAVQVATDDGMKQYLIERGLRRGSDFAKAIGIEPQTTLEALLHKAQAYIAYEEREAAINVRNPRQETSSGHNRGSSRGGGDRKNDERPRDKTRGPTNQFTSYTPLICSREHILAEVTAAEFKSYGVRMPKQVPPKRDADKTKWCRYHKTHGHVTEECIQLKDAIEILIRAGRLDRYKKQDDHPR